MNSRPPYASLGLLTLLFPGATSIAAVMNPWADRVVAYAPGSLQESPIGSGAYFTEPVAALGPVSSAASVLVPSNDVVQLGQGGSITLGFDEPIQNNRALPGTANPLGYDFIIFGNAFEAGALGSGLFFREPGFVEVARRGTDGLPEQWFLLLADIAPAGLTGGLDSGPGSLYSGYADVHPVNGSGNPLLPPDAVEGAGGDGFFLERAVLQSSPGIPLLDVTGQPQLVALGQISFIRITDAIPGDAGVTGFYTTDIDAVVDLPGVVPEPSTMACSAVAIAALLACRRRRQTP